MMVEVAMQSVFPKLRRLSISFEIKIEELPTIENICIEEVDMEAKKGMATVDTAAWI
jgi:hypothetical protein